QDKASCHLVIRWKGGAVTELDVDTAYRPQPTIKTDEDTIDLLRRLALHYTDEQIAGILNRQGRLSARGERFTAVKVQSLRQHRGIPRDQPNGTDQAGSELLPIARAAKVFGIAPSTLHRWIGDGFIAAEQPTPGAPWHIRMSNDLKSQFVEEAPPGWVTMWEAMKALGVSRQTVLQRVKRGELRALHLRSGRRKASGLNSQNRLRVPTAPSSTISMSSGGSESMTPRKTRHTTHLKNFPETMCVRREHHPLFGTWLPVYGWMRRHGRLDLILVLPDGSKSLMPGSWTDLDPQIAGTPEPEPS